MSCNDVSSIKEKMRHQKHLRIVLKHATVFFLGCLQRTLAALFVFLFFQPRSFKVEVKTPPFIPTSTLIIPPSKSMFNHTKPLPFPIGKGSTLILFSTLIYLFSYLAYSFTWTCLYFSSFRAQLEILIPLRNVSPFLSLSIPPHSLVGIHRRHWSHFLSAQKLLTASTLLRSLWLDRVLPHPQLDWL